MFFIGRRRSPSPPTDVPVKRQRTMPPPLPGEPIHQTRSATAKAAEPNIMTRAGRKKSIEDSRAGRRAKF